MPPPNVFVLDTSGFLGFETLENLRESGGVRENGDPRVRAYCSSMNASGK